jgi:hypothetical protein
MISFRETVDSVERLSALMKSVAELQSAVEHALEYMADFENMLDYPRTKNFQTVEEALHYVDKVLKPRLSTVRAALESGTQGHLKQLRQAADQAERLTVRLRILADGDSGGFFG